MEFLLGGLGVRCSWLFLIVLAIQDATRPGIALTRADDFGMCDRSLSDDDSEIRVFIGHELSLSCLTDIEPPQNSLTWFKNNNTIPNDERIVIDRGRVPCMLTMGEGSDENCDVLQLSILNVIKDDEGLYICRKAGRENGTIFVRVVEETTVIRLHLTQPTCSSNASLDDVLLPSDTILLTCMTDEYTYSAGSLDWVGHESIQMKDNDSYSTTLVVNVETALSSQLLCSLSCDENVQLCQEKNLSCRVPLFTATPEYQEAEVGGNVSFTCEISLNNYSISWFLPGNLDHDQFYSQSGNEGRTLTFTILNLSPDQSGSFICMVRRNGMEVGVSRTVTLEVTSSLNTSSSMSSTEDSGTSVLDAGTNIRSTMASTTPHHRSTLCVSLRRLDTMPSLSSLGLNHVIIIAVCGGIAFIVFIAITVCIVCCRQRNNEPAMDINPVMAFGDLSNDNAVNIDVHFNVYTQHTIYDEGARSSDILHLDSTRRIPSVIQGHNNDHANRASSFIPISEDEIDVGERRKHEDDEPGRKLSYYVENDVYVSYDSNA